MSNIFVNAEKSEGAKSLKEKAMEAKLKAEEIYNKTKAMAFSSIPTGMESIRTSITSIIDSATELVDSKIKEETGYSCIELQYKCSEGIKKFKEYKQLAKEKTSSKPDLKGMTEDEKIKFEEELKIKKAKKKKEFKEWLTSQSDAIYNAFFMVQFKESLDTISSSVNKLWNGGYETFKEGIEDLQALQKFYK